MVSIGSAWGVGTWSDDTWALGTWGGAEAPTVVDPPSGGYFDYGTWTERKKRIPVEISAIIEQVAESQVAALEIDAQKQKRELQLRLRLKDLQYETRYLEALAARREELIHVELAQRMRTQHNNNAITTLMLMALLDS